MTLNYDVEKSYAWYFLCYYYYFNLWKHVCYDM